MNQPSTSKERDNLLTMADTELLKHCRAETFRGSGSGGQKRNVTDSAVRLTHEKSGISAESDKTRSQHRNRFDAVSALRRALAIEWRTPLPSSFSELPPKPSRRNQDFALWMATVLDILAECDWQVGTAARRGKTSTGRLVKDLADDRQLWREVNRQRQKHGLKPLKMQ